MIFSETFILAALAARQDALIIVTLNTIYCLYAKLLRFYCYFYYYYFARE